MKIRVTETDINTGVTHSVAFCPVALAITRALENRRVAVGSETTEVHVREGVEIGADWVRHKNPPEVVTFIRRFDNGMRVEPFEFEMPIDEQEEV